MTKRRILSALIWLGLGAAGLPVAAQQGGDLQAQILYAFHTEDRHQLADLIDALKTRLQDADDEALRYHLAHADYRFGRLVPASEAAEADAAWSDCVDRLKPALRTGVKSAEALALQSACYAELAAVRVLESALLRRRAADRLAAAYQLAPRNPRVNLLMALDGLEHSPPGSPANQAGFLRLEHAVQLFEGSSGTGIDAPGWGHAEAYLALGRQLLLRGDFLGGRNWIEKSLIAAPDYKAAQQQLAAIAGR